MLSKDKYKSSHEDELKILTPKQMLQRLPIALAQVKTREQVIHLKTYWIKSDNSYILCIEKKKLQKKYITTWWIQ